MLKYLVKRLGMAIVVLIGVSMIIYFLTRLMPADFVASKLAGMQSGGATVTEEMEKMLYDQYGLGDNSFAGIFTGYFKWLGNMLRFDFGESYFDQKPVIESISSRMGVSFMVAFIATIFEFMIAIPLGITAATHQYKLRDYVVTIFVMIGISLPSFFFGNVLKMIFGEQGRLGWLPEFGLQAGAGGADFLSTLPDIAAHLVLPIATVVILSIGGRMRMTRANMLEVLGSDYIRTARAKGLSETKVIYRHAFRNTLIPIVTTLAGLLPALFSGAIITEKVFDLPGIGNFALTAMQQGDLPFIMGYNIFLAALSVIGVLLSDLMYVLVDPRVKLK